MSRSWHGLACAAILSACGSNEQVRALDSTRIPAVVDSIVTLSLQSGEVAGVSVAIMRGDQVMLDRGYGFSDVGKHTRATAATRYRIGSLTKQFTAASILILADKGQLDLDARLSDFLPGFDPIGPPITLRQLLSHTSGLRSFTDFDSATTASFRMARSHDALLSAVSGAGRDAAPGAWWHYNNSGYYLLGLVAQQVTHRPFWNFLQDAVLSRTDWRGIEECEVNPRSGLATGYVVAGHRLVPTGHGSLLPSFSAGGLCATAADLARWQRALHTGKVISRSAHRAMITPAVLSDGTRTSYGFGLFVGTVEGHTVYMHNGRLDGFSAQGAYYPDDEISVVVLSNTESSVAERLEQEISAAIVGLDSPRPHDRSDDPEGLASYEGAYEDGPVTIPVWEQRGRLAIRAPSGDTVLADPFGRATFVQEGDPSTTFHFLDDAAGRRRLEVRRRGMLFALAERSD